MQAEMARRRGATQRVLELFQSRPLVWIAWADLAAVGGALAWRSRVVDARQIVAKDGHRIEWNKQVQASAYRYVPYVPLGPAADQYRTQPSFF